MSGTQQEKQFYDFTFDELSAIKLLRQFGAVNILHQKRTGEYHCNILLAPICWNFISIVQ